MISQARILESVSFPSPGDLPDPGIRPTYPTLAGGSFTTESPRKLTYVCTWANVFFWKAIRSKNQVSSPLIWITLKRIRDGSNCWWLLLVDHVGRKISLNVFNLIPPLNFEAEDNWYRSRLKWGHLHPCNVGLDSNLGGEKRLPCVLQEAEQHPRPLPPGGQWRTALPAGMTTPNASGCCRKSTGKTVKLPPGENYHFK